MLTIGDVLPRVARSAGGSGVCIDSPEGRATALQLYNDINEELMQDGSWEGATANVEFWTCEQCIALPSQMESILAFAINRRPGPIRPEGWRFIEGGPGVNDACSPHELQDLGDNYATMRDLPTPMQLMIYSDRPEEGAPCAIIQGTQPDGREVMRGDLPGFLHEPGEKLAIRPAAFAPTDGTQAKAILSRATFMTRPSSVIKPKTRGHVFLYGYSATEQVWLATYRPYETRPTFRRYRVNAPVGNNPVSIVAKVALRFVPGIHDDELALLQLGPVYEIYAKALAHRRANQFDDYAKYRNSALAKLKGQRENKTATQTHQPSFSLVRSGASIAQVPR